MKPFFTTNYFTSEAFFKILWKFQKLLSEIPLDGWWRTRTRFLSPCLYFALILISFFDGIINTVNFPGNHTMQLFSRSVKKSHDLLQTKNINKYISKNMRKYGQICFMWKWKYLIYPLTKKNCTDYRISTVVLSINILYNYSCTIQKPKDLHNQVQVVLVSKTKLTYLLSFQKWVQNRGLLQQ